MTEISVIIPTTAEASRSKSVFRAIESVTTAQTRTAIPIIVANGSHCEPDLIRRLKSHSRSRFFYLDEGSLPRARHFGRQMVDTKYFGFIDDDDEYLPDALSLRSKPMEENPEVDATVSNGLCMLSGGSAPYISDLDAVRADPSSSLIYENWLASCGGLFRTDTIGEDFFHPELKYLEWTYTALRLSLTRRIAFIDEPTFVNHTTPGSLSRSAAYSQGLPNAIGQLLALDMPRPLRGELRLKRCAAFHALCSLHLEKGRKKAAWGYHLRSLLHPTAFLQYGLYTRRLFYTNDKARRGEEEQEPSPLLR